MQDFLNLINEASRQILISVVIAGLAGIWVALRAQRRWIGRNFFDRVSVSLNYVVDGVFQIRTLQERACVDVFRNASVVKAVRKASRARKTEGILDLPRDDYWYYLNPVLNSISELFAEGYVEEASGSPIDSRTFLLFLTGFDSPAARQGKIRAMLITEDLLLQTAGEPPSFRNDFHRLRWETLQEVRAEWVESEGKTPRIRTISLPLKNGGRDTIESRRLGSN